jgi:16S rRNA processing protein RimM
MPIPDHKSSKFSRNSSGSLENSEPEFLEIGKIGKSHGLRGEVWMILSTDFPERLIPGKIVYLGKDLEPKTIHSFQLIGSRGLMSFNGINNPEEADLYKNCLIYIEAKHLPKLPDGEYYHHELIGMRVIDEEHQDIGMLTDILQTGSNDVYVVINEDDKAKEVLIPAIKSVIISVDIENKTMVVKLQEWI